MGVIQRGPSWPKCTTNLAATPTVTTPGTAITAGASNVDGTAVALTGALAHDVEYLVLHLIGFNVTTEEINVLVDILVDPAGGTTWATAPLINDLLAVSPTYAAATPLSKVYEFPLYVPKGASLGARARTNRGTDVTTGSIVVFAQGANSNRNSPCGQYVQTIGATAASSQGTDHTAGNTGAFSSWVNFGSPLEHKSLALQFAGGNTDAGASAFAYYFEFGVAGVAIGPPLVYVQQINEASINMPTGPIFCELPAGTQLQVRGTCQSTAEPVDLCVYVTI